MNYMTSDMFEKAAAADRYLLRGRWAYFSVVIELLKRMKPTSIIEIGPSAHGRLAAESTTVDIITTSKPDICMDIRKTPWPISGKQFDVLVALQVWEHLDGHQREAFAEARLTCSRAILSFPFMMNTAPDMAHHQINREIIDDWTLNTPPVEEILVGNRLIRVYSFWKT